MTFVSSTPLALLAFAAILALGPVRGVIILICAMPFGSTAAFALGGAGTVSLQDFCILAMWMSLIGRTGHVRRIVTMAKPGQAGFPLFLLLVVAGLGVFFLPQVFADRTGVFVTVAKKDYATIALTPLAPSNTPIVQTLRFLVACSAFFLIAGVFVQGQIRRYAVIAITTATLAHIGLSVADIASHAAGYPDFLDGLRTMRAAMLDNQYLGGIKRVSGGFPEPSAYAYFTMALFGFWLHQAQSPNAIKWAPAFAIATTVLLIRSTSSAAYVGMTVFLAWFVVTNIKLLTHKRSAAQLSLVCIALVPAITGTALAAYSLNEQVANVVDSVLINKVSSESATERMDWNQQAIVNLRDTLGLGTGFGAGRASGWFFACLGGLGLLGMALYLWFIFKALVPAPKGADPLSGSFKAGCVALLIQACLTKPYPNLEAVFFVFAGLAVALARQGYRT